MYSRSKDHLYSVEVNGTYNHKDAMQQCLLRYLKSRDPPLRLSDSLISALKTVRYVSGIFQQSMKHKTIHSASPMLVPLASVVDPNDPERRLCCFFSVKESNFHKRIYYIRGFAWSDEPYVLISPCLRIKNKVSALWIRPNVLCPDLSLVAEEVREDGVGFDAVHEDEVGFDEVCIDEAETKPAENLSTAYSIPIQTPTENKPIPSPPSPPPHPETPIPDRQSKFTIPHRLRLPDFISHTPPKTISASMTCIATKLYFSCIVMASKYTGKYFDTKYKSWERLCLQYPDETEAATRIVCASACRKSFSTTLYCDAAACIATSCFETIMDTRTRIAAFKDNHIPFDVTTLTKKYKGNITHYFQHCATARVQSCAEFMCKQFALNGVNDFNEANTPKWLYHTLCDLGDCWDGIAAEYGVVADFADVVLDFGSDSDNE